MNNENTQQDVLIVGGGPAGLSAALWCADLGLAVTLLERGSDIGGQLHSIYNPIENYIGVTAPDGREMLSHFRSSVERFSFRRRLNCEVTGLDPNSSHIRLADGEEIGFKVLIIATGVRRRVLGVPGEAEYRGKGIIESGARDKEALAGKRVLIVGGGDAAVENALMISQHAASVKLVHRRSELSARKEFQRELRTRTNVETIFNSVVTRIIGDAHVSAVELRYLPSGEVRIQAFDRVLIRIGVVPNTEFVRDVVDLDHRDYIKVGPTCETNVAGVFAVGDAANPVSPTISTAVGTGATAAKAAHSLIKIKQHGL